MTAPSIEELDLAQCAQEPIHIPGGIQPHGALLVVEPQQLMVIQESRNASEILGAAYPRDRRLEAAWVRSEFLDVLKQWLASSDPSLQHTADINGVPLQVLGYRTAQGVLLEFEQPPQNERETLDALYPRIARYIEDLQATSSVAQLCQGAAQFFRAITGFDRVLIYRFDTDWHGEVIAEDGNGVLPSYLGLHFPASDIPAQARELYRVNRLRLIPDANYTPVPIEPEHSPIDGAALDLSCAALRSVSPVHLEYMRNMGTLASMSISILVDGRLYGLISCHNATPKRLNAQVRTACDLLGKVVSLQLGARESGLYAARRIDLKKLEGSLLASLATAKTFQEGLNQNHGLWLELAGASGSAVLTESGVFTAGQTPPLPRLQALAARLQQQQVEEVFVTSALALEWPEFADIADVASGVLAISVSQLHPSYIMWFRPEVVRTVRWGGDPTKSVQAGEQRLHPRNSFDVWKQQLRSRSEPWSRAEIDSIAEFRTAIVNFVLRRAEERAALTQQLERSNRELESFSYSVSHDLRAPFRHIVGYAQLLKDQDSVLSDKARHYIDSIKDAAHTAGRLVDDLLNFSHLGRTALNVEPVDMSKIVNEVLRSIEPDIVGRDIEWRIGALPTARGDHALLRQAWANLIGNAVKYSRDKQPAIIDISGEVTARESVYTIRDNGVGFDMAYVGKLFGVFQRLHRMEEFEGTGIGLALTQRVIERHGGWIKAEGQLGVGAIFRFGLPR